MHRWNKIIPVSLAGVTVDPATALLCSADWSGLSAGLWTVHDISSVPAKFKNFFKLPGSRVTFYS